MKLESVGILIGLRPFNERDALAHIFTRDFGVMAGMLRGAIVARKNKPLVGQVGAVSWNARLDSQLGVFHWESDKNLVAPLMLNPRLLTLVNSAFALVYTMLPEREKYESLYLRTNDLLCDLTDENYLAWEIYLLQELGYALDLTHCSGCGCMNDLNYLSPRTGRAVCNNCAAPYLDKVYQLPITLNVTKKFLGHICEQQGISLPLARGILKD